MKNKKLIIIGSIVGVLVIAAVAVTIILVSRAKKLANNIENSVEGIINTYNNTVEDNTVANQNKADKTENEANTENNKDEDKSENKTEGNSSVEGITGKYELIEMKDKDNDFGEEMISLLKGYGYSVYIVFNEDGTGKFDFMGQDDKFKYDDKNITANSITTPYTFDGDKVTLTQEAASLVFKKVE